MKKGREDNGRNCVVQWLIKNGTGKTLLSVHASVRGNRLRQPACCRSDLQHFSAEENVTSR